jgi:hypothetical protein
MSGNPSTLTINLGASVAAGTYTLTIVGVGSAATHSTQFFLTVSAQAAGPSVTPNATEPNVSKSSCRSAGSRTNRRDSEQREQSADNYGSEHRRWERLRLCASASSKLSLDPQPEHLVSVSSVFSAQRYRTKAWQDIRLGQRSGQSPRVIVHRRFRFKEQ